MRWGTTDRLPGHELARQLLVVEGGLRPRTLARLSEPRGILYRVGAVQPVESHRSITVQRPELHQISDLWRIQAQYAFIEVTGFTFIAL